MENPWAGEVTICLNGNEYILKLTLGALAQLEASMSEGSLLDIVKRIEAGKTSANDIIHIINAGLRGGGYNESEGFVEAAEIRGGPLEAARVAATLIVRAFSSAS